MAFSNQATAQDVEVSFINATDFDDLGLVEHGVVGEGGTVELVVKLSAPSSSPVTVMYKTQSTGTGLGYATNGDDFTVPVPNASIRFIESTTGVISIPTSQDTIDEPDETFKVILTSATNADLSQTASDLEITVTILDDDDPPVIQLTRNTNSSINEGDSATILFSVFNDASNTTTKSARDIQIYFWLNCESNGPNEYCFNPHNELHHGRNEIIVTLSAGSTTVEYVISTDDDLIYELGERIEVELIGDQVYRGSNPRHYERRGGDHDEIRIDIKNDENPVADHSVDVGFEEDGIRVSEGVADGMAEIEISVSELTPNVVTVNYYIFTGFGPTSASHGTDFVAPVSSPPPVATIPANERSTIIRVPILQDTIDEDDEGFNIYLANPVNAGFVTDNRFFVRRQPDIGVSIIDDDAPPVIEVSRDSEAGIKEGESVTLTFSILTDAINKTTSSQKGNFNFEISITENNVLSTTIERANRPDRPEIPVDFASGETSTTYTVMIPRNYVHEINRSFTLSIIQHAPHFGAPPPYIRSPTNYEITVPIIDVDDPPVIELSHPANQALAENGGSFTIQTDIFTDQSNTTQLSAENIEIHYAITDSIGDFIANSDERSSIIMPRGSYRQTKSIDIQDNFVDRDDSSITIALEDDRGTILYTKSSDPEKNSITINFVDDDDPPVIGIINEPIMTVNEGSFAVFSLGIIEEGGSTTILSALDIEIQVTIAETSGDYLDPNPTNPVVVTLSAREPFTEYIVIPTDDTIDETNGEITITIEDDVSSNNPVHYFKSSIKFSETVVIIDDDPSSNASLSLVSFKIPADSVDESIAGGMVELDVEIIPAVAEIITVTYATSITGIGSGHATADVDFTYSSISSPLEIRIPANETAAKIQIPISPDTIDEPDETFIVTLSNPTSITNWEIADNSEMMVTILDDDLAIPEISIMANTDFVTEGETITFNITSVNPDRITIDLDFNVIQSGNFMLWRVTRSIKLIDDEEPFELNVRTHDDEIDEPHGSVTVTINESSHYILMDGSNTETVEIYDNDDPNQPELPRISVASVAFNAIFEYLSMPQTGQPAAAESTFPAVSIQVVKLVIDEGGIASFRVNSVSNVAGVSIAVALQVSSVGDFFEFNQPHTRTVSLRGEDSTGLFFPTIDDTLAEDDGSITISIAAHSSYKIAENQGSATVVISDAIDRQAREDLITARAQEFLPDVVGNMAARTSQTIEQRFQQAFSGTGSAVLNLGGQEAIREMIKKGGEIVNDDSFSLRSFLGDSSFALTLLSADQFAAPTTVWGIGDYRDLSPSSSNSSEAWEAEAFTGHIGLDTMIGQEILTGVSASFNENLVDFNSDDSIEDTLAYALDTTSINPFIGWKSPTDDAEIRAIAGFGVGEFSVDQARYDVEKLTSRSYSLALAGNKELYSTDSILNGNSKLNLIGESWMARQFIDGKDGVLADLQTDAQYYRIRTEGTHEFTFERGSTLTPKVSLGMRGDTKAEQSTLGMEVIGGINFVNPLGLKWEGAGSMLLGNENTVQKISASSTFGFDLGNDKLGTTLTLSPTWGQSSYDAQNNLWDSNILQDDSEMGQYTNGTQIDSEIGYGFAIGDNTGILTLYSGYEFDQQVDDELMVGTRVSIASNFDLDVEGSQEIGTEGSNPTKVQFNGRLSW